MPRLGAFVPSNYFAVIYVLVYSACRLRARPDQCRFSAAVLDRSAAQGSKTAPTRGGVSAQAGKGALIKVAACGPDL